MKLGGEASQPAGIKPRLHGPLRAIDLGRSLQGMRAVGCVLVALLRLHFLWICCASQVYHRLSSRCRIQAGLFHCI
jgi:hypothetical protein